MTIARFDKIADPQERAIAALCWNLRPGTADDDYVQDVLTRSVGNLVDHERDVLARRILDVLKEVMGPPDSGLHLSPEAADITAAAMFEALEQEGPQPSVEPEPPAQPEWPKGAPRPDPDEVVAVLMRESMAREFEQRCLRRTRGGTELAGPVLFRENDVPTYIIGITDAEAQSR